MRVLANLSNINELFDRVELPYRFTDNEGVDQTCQIKGWRCKACKWDSFDGLQGLPFPHECERAIFVTPATQRFA